MKLRLAVLFLTAAIFAGNAAAQTCPAYETLPPLPSGLGRMMEELDAAVNNRCQIYKWRVNWTTNHQNFTNFNGGTQNLQVVAGAIALLRDANKATAVNFF